MKKTKSKTKVTKDERTHAFVLLDRQVLPYGQEDSVHEKGPQGRNGRWEVMYDFTEGMGEISGFGGGYEATCRRMLKNALEWCDANPEAAKKLNYEGIENVYGIFEAKGAAAKALDKAMMAGTDETGGVTGAQHQAVATDVLWILKNGWDAFVKEMSKGVKT